MLTVAILINWQPIMARSAVNTGNVLVFFGLVHGDDDYYYGLSGPTGLDLFTN